jgi:hypothetical protein
MQVSDCADFRTKIYNGDRSCVFGFMRALATAVLTKRSRSLIVFQRLIDFTLVDPGGHHRRCYFVRGSYMKSRLRVVGKDELVPDISIVPEADALPTLKQVAECQRRR